MRLPRDLSATDLANSLKSLGYSPTRQSGSHIRLTTNQNGNTTSPFRVTRRFVSAR